MRAKEYAGVKSELAARISNPANNIGGLESLICRTIQNRPQNEDAIRGIR